jgi:hypothetical protein
MRWINTSVRESYPRSISSPRTCNKTRGSARSPTAGRPSTPNGTGPSSTPCATPSSPAATKTGRSEALRDAITTIYNGDAFHRVIYTESHDEVANGRARVPTEVNPDDPTGWHAQKRSTVGAALVLTSPGIPMLFQGQEFLQGAVVPRRRAAGLGPQRGLPRHRAALSRPHPAAPQLARHDPRAHWPARRLLPPQRGRQCPRLPPVVRRGPGRQRRGRRQPPPRGPHGLPHWYAARRPVAARAQQRCADLQRRLRRLLVDRHRPTAFWCIRCACSPENGPRGSRIPVRGSPCTGSFSP